MINNESIVTASMPFKELCSVRFYIGVSMERNKANPELFELYKILDTEIKRIVKENGGYDNPPTIQESEP